MIVLILISLAITLLVLRWFLTTDAATITQVLKRSGLILLIAALVFLIFTGRLSFIFPLLFALLPIIIPALKRLLNLENAGPRHNGNGTKMTIKEAFEALDLKSNASRQEIIDAHKRLMKKIHPDMGGSTYLAQKLNEAKELLLKERK